VTHKLLVKCPQRSAAQLGRYTLGSITSWFLALVSPLLLAACSEPVATGSAKTTAATSPQALFSQVQSSIASGQALDSTKPCHLDQRHQRADQLQSGFVSDFLKMTIPTTYSFTLSSTDSVVEAIYKQPLPAVTVRIRATLKEFRCESFTIDDGSSETAPGSGLTAMAHNPSLERP
jgi:hypothetical protein